MNVLRTILAELLGLFVDDWAFALLILLWAGVFASPLRRVFGVWAGPALFAGLTAIVLIFVLRRAKR
jgi:hypothetical protein